jgi:hypothetical protein
MPSIRMSKNLSFKNEYHLGDCLYQLHYQLALFSQAAVASTLYARPEYHAELVQFIPVGVDVSVAPAEVAPDDAVNSWIGHEDFHTKHPNWHDYHAFYIDFFKALSRRVGVRPPFSQPGHMFFNSPRIPERRIDPRGYDWLVINAAPRSGQFDFASCQWLHLVTALRNVRQTVITTHPCGLQHIPATIDLGYKVIDIAKLSTQVKNVVAIDTGPTGSTFNAWNQTTVKNRFILHRTNYFTHAGCHRVAAWADLWPAIQASGALSRTMT